MAIDKEPTGLHQIWTQGQSKKLIGTSAMALKLMERSPDPMLSYEKLHEINKRAKPGQMMKYKLTIQLYKIYNSDTMTDD